MPDPAPPASSLATPTKDDTNMGMLLYILALVTGFIGPLILWLVKKDSSRFVDDQGKEVLNWCITMAIGYVVCFLLMFVLIGVFLMPLLILAHFIFTIVGAVQASKGVAYRFPFALRLLK
ncbi:MAG: DUF4870 domain-containing protein [Planctomycetota bacterium]